MTLDGDVCSSVATKHNDGTKQVELYAGATGRAFGGAPPGLSKCRGAPRSPARVHAKAMGFDLFHQEDVLERDGCAIDEGIQVSATL